MACWGSWSLLVFIPEDQCLLARNMFWIYTWLRGLYLYLLYEECRNVISYLQLDSCWYSYYTFRQFHSTPSSAKRSQLLLNLRACLSVHLVTIPLRSLITRVTDIQFNGDPWSFINHSLHGYICIRQASLGRFLFATHCKDLPLSCFY